MAERGPTVIERMVTKYINTLNHQPDDCRDATLAMLAAVRELYEMSLDASGVWSQYGYLKHIIQEHERRAGGKDQ